MSELKIAKPAKKRELGMGIHALLSKMDNQAQATVEERVELVRELSHSVAMIPLDEIEVNPWQPRKEFSTEALEELAESLRTYGLIQPLTVRRLADKQYQLISGERRMRASRIAGLTEVPAYVRIANDQEMIEMALVENIQREDLNAIEVAFSYQRLLDECSLTHETLSSRVGKKRSTVTNFLRLLKLPPDIQKGLKDNALSMGHARALLGVNDYALQSSLAKKIAAEDLSVRAVEELIRRYNEPKKAKEVAAAPKLSADYQTVQTNLRSRYGTKVVLKHNAKGAGQIAIPFTSTNDLNRLLDLLER